MDSARKAKETKGAWIVHHGKKVSIVQNAASEFPAIDEAAKAANLLVRLGETNQTALPTNVVEAVARAAGLNPRYELQGLLGTLEERRLIERTSKEVAILGVTTRGVLSQAADHFDSCDPSKVESAAIELAELTSRSPAKFDFAREYIGDHCNLSDEETRDFLAQSESIGFVDTEGNDGDKLLFNGHLFRRDNIVKTNRVLESLSSQEKGKINDFQSTLMENGCVPVSKADDILGSKLQTKLLAAGLYDRHVVSNEGGEHVFLTSPAAFHKFVDPLVDDNFDLAKAFVAALYYGMTRSTYIRGHIFFIEALLSKLIRGETVGPASAIGHDYKVLEERRVVQIRRIGSEFYMKLLKKEVGELALEVLQCGNADTSPIRTIPAAPMTGYTDPEHSRVQLRKGQGVRSKLQTLDVLMALRQGGTL